MNIDEEIGRRLAELRKRLGLRQEDFLTQLRTRGVDWTQATLSRVESGKRPVKLAEAFTIADALGVDPADLSPARSDIAYRIESLKLRLNELKEEVVTAVSRRDQTRNGIAALALARRLTTGESDFEVNVTAHRFVSLLSIWAKAAPGLEPWREPFQLEDGLELLDISVEVEPDPNDYDPEGEAAWGRDLERNVEHALRDRYPDLRFAPESERLLKVAGVTEFLDDPGPLKSSGVAALRVALGMGPNGR